MLEILSGYGLFLLKALTIGFTIFLVVVGIVMALKDGKDSTYGDITVTNIGETYGDLAEALHDGMDLEKPKKAKEDEARKTKRVFVLNFKGDMNATAVKTLREEITTILSLAKTSDEVVVRLESYGGVVHEYGLAASQLLRLRQRDIPLTICIDKVAASGGYLMACVGNNILAAPFAIVCSIGVISQVPNFNRLLKKYDVDYEELTAGEYKRTVSIWGEITEKGRKKFIAQLEDVHTSFKEFLQENREQVDICAVATGEYWYGKRALELHLVDKIIVSDDYLMALQAESEVYEVSYKAKQSLRTRLAETLEESLRGALNVLWEKTQTRMIT